jgi:hypothetical protein
MTCVVADPTAAGQFALRAALPRLLERFEALERV